MNGHTIVTEAVIIKYIAIICLCGLFGFGEQKPPHHQRICFLCTFKLYLNRSFSFVRPSKFTNIPTLRSMIRKNIH